MIDGRSVEYAYMLQNMQDVVIRVQFHRKYASRYVLKGELAQKRRA